MSMSLTTSGVHHVALRTTNLERARAFYLDTLGFPLALEGPGIFLFLAGATAVAIRGPEAQTPPNDVFSPFRAGLDHLALGCGEEAELTRVARALNNAGIENTGIRLDPALNREYVAFKDPDRIAWEFYMAPDVARKAVLSYFDGLRTGRVDTIAFAPDVRFESPLSPPMRGAESVRGFLQGVLPAIVGVRVDDLLSQGEHVAVRFELQTVHGAVPAFDFFRVVNGAIVEARPYYDPRPLLAAEPVR